MLKRMLFFLLSWFSAFPLFGKEVEIAKVNDIEIWYETFGNKEDPALLLIMGGCNQGVMWPAHFCQKFADEGFFVIRYDHRDTGLSTCIDFDKNPYDLLDMAKDAVDLLDYLNVQRAHLFGFSMGGAIAELIAVHYPDKVETIALMSSSCDFRPSSLAYDGLPEEEGGLSRPKDEYLAWMAGFLKSPPSNQDDMLEERLKAWRILNGHKAKFNEVSNREINQQFLDRLKYPQGFVNHLKAIKLSLDLIEVVPYQVKVPTVIFQGSEDPIFPPDHGDALSSAIHGSKYIFAIGMGHVLNDQFYDVLIDGFKRNLKSNNSE